MMMKHTDCGAAVKRLESADKGRSHTKPDQAEGFGSVEVWSHCRAARTLGKTQVDTNRVGQHCAGVGYQIRPAAATAAVTSLAVAGPSPLVHSTPCKHAGWHPGAQAGGTAGRAAGCSLRRRLAAAVPRHHAPVQAVQPADHAGAFTTNNSATTAGALHLLLWSCKSLRLSFPLAPSLPW